MKKYYGEKKLSQNLAGINTAGQGRDLVFARFEISLYEFSFSTSYWYNLYSWYDMVYSCGYIENLAGINTGQGKGLRTWEAIWFSHDLT